MKNNAPKNPNDANLTIRDHMDPDKHWIGETLPAPTQGDLAATVGITSGPGDSPFPARADHMHKVDIALLPVFSTYNPSIVGITLGSGATINTRVMKIPAGSGGTKFLYDVAVQISFGTGGSVDGDVNISLPAAADLLFHGQGMFGISGWRYDLTWNTLNSGSTSAVVRPLTYRPTATEVTRAVDIAGINMAGILPAYTIASGNYISVHGSYIGSS
jgi:hypothetical protein